MKTIPFDPKFYEKRLKHTARFLRERFGTPPSFAVVFGSGLGQALLKQRAPKKSLSYSRIPYFGRVTVKGHAGMFHFMEKRKKNSASAVILQGRSHLYEGIPLEQMVFPYRALAVWGVKRIILTNASGSLRKAFRPGELVWIKDHINMMGANPLRGPNLDFLGPRFPSLSNLYRNDFSKWILRIARQKKIRLAGGVYVALAGPSYETPAEVSAFQKLGADLVGMSTVPEAIASAHAGMEVAALSAVSNSCLVKNYTPSHEEVLARAGLVDRKLAELLLQLLDSGFK